MPVSYVTADDFDSICGERQLLWTDGGSYSSAAFSRAAELASAIARSVAVNAGHDPADGSADDMVRMTALAVLIRIGYARKQRDIPPDLLDLFGPIPEAVRTGDLPLPDSSVDEFDAVGGVKFTDSSSTSSAGKPPVFKDLRFVY